MDWKTWESHKAGVAKLSVEEAEQYVTELILSRSIALPTRDEKKVCLCTPAQLQTISRSRRVMQTLGMIVKSRHLEYYYQAVYLLQFLHNLYPNAIPVQDYGKLLVYLKVEAVIFVACCSMSTDRVQVAQCLMTQLFDDYNCESCNVADNQHLENVHNEGRVKLSQILATNDKLRLINLSVEQLSSQEYHKAMCEILEGFFKGIDDALPPPTIIQIIQDFQKSTSTKNSTSKYVPPSVIPPQAPMKGKSLASKQFAKADPPKSSRHDEIMASSNMLAGSSKDTSTAALVNVISPSKPAGPSSVVVAANDVRKSVQDGASKTVNLASNITSGSAKIASSSVADSPQPQAINSPMPTEDASDSSDYTADNCSDLKFISTHSRIKRTPVPSKRLIPLVTNMRCRRNLIRSNSKCDCGTAQPKIKTVRIVLSPLPKEDYMHHLKLAPNKPGKASTSPVQQKEPPHKESVSSLSGSVLHSSSDEDPTNDFNKTYMVPCTQRRAPLTKYTSFLEDRRIRLQNNQEQLHTPESENSGIVTRIKRKRKSAPPVRYAPFAGFKRHWGDPQSYNRERSGTPDSESVISESVTSSVGSDPPLVNLDT